MKLLFGSIVLFIATLSLSQTNSNPDSLASPILEETLKSDTTDMLIGFNAVEKTGYVPTSDTPELVADRLSCIEHRVPLTYNKRVHAFINYFTIKDRDYTRMILGRKDIYFPIFEAYLKKYNLPDELKYLSIVESGLNPKAISKARAVGLWQFMSTTGRYFGLRNDWYIDDRMDPEKSTEAACKYLTQLYNMFGDWELVLAAYNSGPGNVRKAIRRSGYKRKFWEIFRYLPRETRAYVPQFIAIMYTLNYSANHNLFEPSENPPVAHDTLSINKFLHFETFANLTGAGMPDLQKLNPSVLHKAIPETGRTYVIKVPIEAKQRLDLNRYAILDSASRVGKQELEAIAKKALGGTYGRDLIRYRVKSGDVLSKIAERYHVRVRDIKSWNNLYSNLIRTGRLLKIWVLPLYHSKSSVTRNTTAQKSESSILLTPGSKVYTVQPGDTLWDISKKFDGLTIEKIKTLNNLNSNKLLPGQKLIVG